ASTSSPGPRDFTLPQVLDAIAQLLELNPIEVKFSADAALHSSLPDFYEKLHTTQRGLHQRVLR
ncbi:unnamed protein product, partial [Amoebophrya sp. A120]